VIASYGYDTDSRVTAINYGTGGGCWSPPTNLGTLSYTFDATGRRTAISGTQAAVNLPANVAGTGVTYNADNEQTKFGGATCGYDRKIRSLIVSGGPVAEGAVRWLGAHPGRADRLARFPGVDAHTRLRHSCRASRTRGAVSTEANDRVRVTSIDH
jgi:hypothetical protein